jgi:hypothetical protein
MGKLQTPDARRAKVFGESAVDGVEADLGKSLVQPDNKKETVKT